MKIGERVILRGIPLPDPEAVVTYVHGPQLVNVVLIRTQQLFESVWCHDAPDRPEHGFYVESADQMGDAATYGDAVSGPTP